MRSLTQSELPGRGVGRGSGGGGGDGRGEAVGGRGADGDGRAAGATVLGVGDGGGVAEGTTGDWVGTGRETADGETVCAGEDAGVGRGPLLHAARTGANTNAIAARVSHRLQRNKAIRSIVGYTLPSRNCCCPIPALLFCPA